ncbi:hypothetical protein CPB84DRAFT_1767362 [Gymnopilus junonius]|uniref:Uncharacterized protein n=1 Tax=Gymnopilus junonius TaxID=109634 RepID=A0A9P5NXT7_GYMJU|nr:hypothetical protein CPB84DRAFT_1767362 [Gymnopilus junonius]
MIRLDVAYTIAVWVEVLFHGVYTSLFALAMRVMLKRRSTSQARRLSSLIFLMATWLMYFVSTFHLFLQMYRYTRAFILLVEPQGPLIYYIDLSRWDSMANNILLCLMSWIGDALVIYRCYFVWDSNPWVITVPTLLLLCAIGVNAYTMFWFSHPFQVNEHVGVALLSAVYPLALLQNVMTTGLITLKIWNQHRASSATGVIDRSSRLSLSRILRIIIESAMIYTIQLFILIILFFLEDNFQIILQSAIVPSVGLVFVLIAVRVQSAKTQTIASHSLATIPAWLDEEDDSRDALDTDISPEDGVRKLSPGGDSESFRQSLANSIRKVHGSATQ